MRREEIFHLKVKHVREVEGIWVFDLHHHELSLKNAASRRLAPLHRCLLELGFIETMVCGRNRETPAKLTDIRPRNTAQTAKLLALIHNRTLLKR